ncbi:MAG: DUF2807 domain-containing protein [Bacteroidales bacterium]|nr:DUF2807 domain-containing protein [Bacteroidales bacterium]
MKKLLTTIACLAVFASGMLSAQVAQYSLDMQPFSNVDISGPFTASIVRGTQYRVLISVSEAYKPYVICSTEGSSLVLSLDEIRVPLEVRRLFRGKGTPDPVFSAIIYSPDLLQSVNLSGKAILQDTEDIFDKARVTFTLSDNASVKALTLSSLVFKLDMKGKSGADFKVTCRETLVDLANSSTLTIDEQSEDSVYSISGSSKSKVHSATKRLTLGAKGNASMTISGTGDGASFELSSTSEVDASRFEVSDADVRMSSVSRLSVSAANILRVNLNGGSTLLFAGDPAVSIDNIRSATMSRLNSAGVSSSRL